MFSDPALKNELEWVLGHWSSIQAAQVYQQADQTNDRDQMSRVSLAPTLFNEVTSAPEITEPRTHWNGNHVMENINNWEVEATAMRSQGKSEEIRKRSLMVGSDVVWTESGASRQRLEPFLLNDPVQLLIIEYLSIFMEKLYVVHAELWSRVFCFHVS